MASFLPHKKFTWADFGRYKYPYTPVATPLVASATNVVIMIAEGFPGVDDIDRQMCDLAVDTDAAHGSCSVLNSSISSTSSSSSSSFRSNEASASGTYRALMPSLFSRVPPTVNFVLDGQKRNCFFLCTLTGCNR